MKKFLPILLLLFCNACAATRLEAAADTDSPSSDAMNNLAIYAISLADTPYHYGGNSPATGFDCSGFVRYVFQNASGWNLPRTSREMSKTGEGDCCGEHARPILAQSLQRGATNHH